MARHHKSKRMMHDYAGNDASHMMEKAADIADRENSRHSVIAMKKAPMMRNERYAGMEARRYQEMRDAGLIHEDHSAVANLPQNVGYRPWPGNDHYGMPEGLDDSYTGVDRQISYDDSKRAEHNVPKKV